MWGTARWASDSEMIINESKWNMFKNIFQVKNLSIVPGVVSGSWYLGYFICCPFVLKGLRWEMVLLWIFLWHQMVFFFYPTHLTTHGLIVHCITVSVNRKQHEKQWHTNTKYVVSGLLLVLINLLCSPLSKKCMHLADSLCSFTFRNLHSLNTSGSPLEQG